jgi:hypothetical protein
MAAGVIWVVVAFIVSRNMTLILVGVAVIAVGQSLFFWPGLLRIVTGWR